MLRDIELNAACTGISQDRERDAGHDPATTGSLGRAPAISAREESARVARRTDRPIATPRVRRRLEFEQDAVQAKEMAERMRRNNPNRPRREANTGESADPDAVGSVRRDINTFTGRADRARARM
ncbi:hypothetical protein LTR49_003532 [Elasticomyces elasticus]|nr:hypothetical protein LTR49_003532 [Elasticomyces elasticus]